MLPLNQSNAFILTAVVTTKRCFMFSRHILTSGWTLKLLPICAGIA